MIHTYKNHIKRIVALAYPVTIGQLGHIMLGVVDSIMVGRVGAVSLAAASLVNGLVFLVMVFGLGMSLAITPLVAIAKGQENHKECGAVLQNALLVNSLLAVGLTITVYFLSELIFHLNQSPEVATQAASYAKVISLSIFPFMIFQSYRQFIEGMFYTRPAMYISIGANIVNAFGNWVLIYGNLGFPAYGLDGAGYATLITRIFMAFTIMMYVTSSRRFKEFNPTPRLRPIDRVIIKKILNIGIPTGFQHFFEVGAFAFSAVMIGWLGSKPLAAHQIALNMASITFMIILGISAAGTIRVGNALGRNNMREVREAAFTAILMAASIMACFGITFIIFRTILPTLYINDPEVISMAASLLIIAALFQVSDGVQAVGLGVLRGITDVKIPMIISLVAYWIIAFPVGYGLGFILNWGVQGIWVGLLLGLTIAAIFFSLRFHLKTKKMMQQP